MQTLCEMVRAANAARAGCVARRCVLIGTIGMILCSPLIPLDGASAKNLSTIGLGGPGGPDSEPYQSPPVPEMPDYLVPFFLLGAARIMYLTRGKMIVGR